MAVRTDADAVKAILQHDYNVRRSPSLEPYIAAASSIVDDLVDAATADEVTVTTAKAALIETWLGAHAYVQMDPHYTSKSTGKAGGSFTGTFGEGLKNSRYGQFAITLDSTGYLAGLADPAAAQATASGFWGGTPSSQQRTHDERN